MNMLSGSSWPSHQTVWFQLALPALKEDALTEDILGDISKAVIKTGTWTTTHPSYITWPKYLMEAVLTSTRIQAMVNCMSTLMVPQTLRLLFA